MNTHSKRLATTFDDLRANNKKALIPFITVGDPAGVAVNDLMHALVDGGADIVELGIPFSDPVADGEVIQKASERAIANGVCVNDCFSVLKAFREKDDKTPVVFMGYLNSTEVYPGGFEGFSDAMESAGADAVILVDLSYESGSSYRKALRSSNIDMINLIAPTTSNARLGRIVKKAGGFVYYVSTRGITGNSGELNADEISKSVKSIKDKADVPVCVGFGIADGEMAKTMASFSDGVVVGSALVKKLYNAARENKNVLAEATSFMASLRHSLDK